MRFHRLPIAYVRRKARANQRKAVGDGARPVEAPNRRFAGPQPALPGRDDGGTRRPSLRKVFGPGLLPGNRDAIAPRKWAEGVRLVEATLERATPGTPPTAWAALAGLWKPSGGLKFRGLSDLLAALFEIDDGQVAVRPVGTGEDPPVGCHPNG